MKDNYNFSSVLENRLLFIGTTLLHLIIYIHAGIIMAAKRMGNNQLSAIITI
tara:strand:+ start:988 stop:1143 length:156 start_codon:yes stop_codon:yes gene_type:complete